LRKGVKASIIRRNFHFLEYYSKGRRKTCWELSRSTVQKGEGEEGRGKGVKTGDKRRLQFGGRNRCTARVPEKWAEPPSGGLSAREKKD